MLIEAVDQAVTAVRLRKIDFADISVDPGDSGRAYFFPLPLPLPFPLPLPLLP